MGLPQGPFMSQVIPSRGAEIDAFAAAPEEPSSGIPVRKFGRHEVNALVVLEQNLRVARGFQPFAAEQMAALRERVRTLAADGRCELFKTTTTYDGKVGREQHHYPPKEKLPA